MWWGYLNLNNWVSSGPNWFNEGWNERCLRLISVYPCISMNLLQIFYSQQNYTFLGVKYVFWGSYLTNFPSAKSIHIWQLSLMTIEWLAKSRVLESFLKKRHLCEIWQEIPIIIKKRAITQKLSRILKFCSLFFVSNRNPKFIEKKRWLFYYVHRMYGSITFKIWLTSYNH